MNKERIQLAVAPREVRGNKVKKLRREGIIPAVIYGPELESGVSVQLDQILFQRLLSKTGETDLIDLTVDGEKEVRPVLVTDVQVDPLRGEAQHVDFFQVNLNEEVDVEVPLEFVGESSAVTNKLGVLLELLSEIPVRVLPANIPHHIEVDISGLSEVGDQIVLSEVQIPEGVQVMLDDIEEIMVVKIDEIRAIEDEPVETEGEETEEGTEEDSTEEDSEEE